MSLTSDETPAKGLSDFFQTIWGDTDGFVYLPTLDRKTETFHKKMFEWPKHHDNIVNHVLSSAAQGLDVYFAPAIFNELGQPDKGNVKGTRVLWAEFDGDAPTNWTESESESARSRSEAVSGPPRDAHGVPEPSMRVQSSGDGREHVYWVLEDFCTDKQWAEDRNRAITYSHRADTSGWDITQILRPPYTKNHKYESVPIVSVISADRNKSFDRQVFEPLLPPPILVSENIQIDELPSVQDVIAKYSWDEAHWKMFRDPHIEKGSRSDALMRLGYFCIETGMTNTETYAILLNADDRWGKYKGRADRKRRLVDIIDRARQKHPYANSELNFAGLQGAPVEEGTALYYGLSDFLETTVEADWVIEDLLEVGGYGMVTSMPGVGKTQWSINLGMCCAIGKKFLHWNIPKPQKVVLFSLEMSHVALLKIMRLIATYYSDEEMKLLQENFIVVPVGQAVSLDKPEGLAFIEQVLDQTKPDGFIIDSVGKLSMQDLSDVVARNLNAKFAHLRSKYGCWQWYIHHNRKASDNNKKPTSLSDVYGNVYIVADMTSVLILWGEPNSPTIEVIPVKNRLAQMKFPFSVLRTEALTFELITEDDSIVENLNRKAMENEQSLGDDPTGDGVFSFG